MGNTLNRYELQNSIDKVYGYFLPSPMQNVGLAGGLDAAFVSAQAECVRHLEAQIANIKSLTFEQFSGKKKLKIVEVDVDIEEQVIAQDVSRELVVGDLVFWNDPDDGISSGFGKIVKIDCDNGITDDDSIILLAMINGGETMARLCELD